jgi:hypothetical protein
VGSMTSGKPPEATITGEALPFGAAPPQQME